MTSIPDVYLMCSASFDTTELVTKVGLKLTSVVDEGGLVCVTIMVVSCGVVSEIVAI